MKIGFLLNFIDFRNDVRRVIDVLSKEHDVVTFIKSENKEVIKPLVEQFAEVRFIDEKITSFTNRLWGFLFSKFGRIPKSVNNYYLTERFLIYSDRNASRRKKRLLIFDIAMKLPKWLSYDCYLDKLKYSRKTNIDGVEKFICLTRTSDDYLFSRLLKERKDVRVYVYSWDHPCKHKQFSKRVEYLVWNDGIRDDMVELQSIERKKIQSIGSSQFGYVHEFHESKKHDLERPYDFNYVYFGCFAGIPDMVRQEVRIIYKLSEILQKVQPQMKLVVRPYPVLKDWSYYDKLAKLTNIIFDDSFKNKDLSTSEDKIIDKFTKIHFAEMFFHLGTTMGLEACFTDTPSFLIDFGYDQNLNNKVNIRHGIHQYQNEKYLMDKHPQNVVKSGAELKILFGDYKDSRYMELNRDIADTFKAASFEEFAEKLISH